MASSWFWCMTHGSAEDSTTSCPPAERLGPYESKDAAEHWRARTDARNETWDQDDREWSGEADG